MAELEIELLAEEIHGGDGGFLRVRRLHLRNRDAEGTLSERYVCDFAVRPKGADAVVVALWRRTHEGVEVLLRTGLRPALWHGRAPELLPIADAERTPWMIEVVAGIIERSDHGEAGIRERASIEAWEEAGLHIAAAQVEFLGAGTFPTPGSMPEKFWLVAAEVPGDAVPEPPPGDGSPMEQGARIHWRGLDAAILACVRGEIADAKTELVLRRLRDRLAT
ncbi:MAG: NUDIX hydrolase [Deltaproteobacteria bacterium]|nr:NUDIX hydrolase [Nannocystaceae bacterium]